MKTAIIGLGVIGTVHYNVLQDLNVDICALCDIDSERLEKFTQFKKYSDYIELLENEKPDVVHICTPHYLHAQMVIECLGRDINVLCEKPLCINDEQLSAIKTAARKSKAQIGVVLQNRYNRSSLFAREFLNDKKIVNGFASVLWHRDMSYYNSALWRGSKQMSGGGVLINQALHTLDLLQLLVGVPESVCAETFNLSLKGQVEVEDTVSAVFYGKSGYTFFATNSSAWDYPVEITIVYEGGTMKVFPNAVMVNGETITFEREKKIFGKLCYGTGHENLIADFYDCIKTGRKFPIDSNEGGKVLKLAFAVYRSHGNKVPI